jgi:uncharacterized protein (TIGR03083 family)
MAGLTEVVRSERLGLVELLETLGPDDWTAPSLCEGWTVQDVAAHLAWSPSLTALEAVALALRAGFRINRLNDDNARRWSARGPEAIVDQLRTDAEQDLRAPGTSEVMALTDAVCHGIDIRRPLGRPAQTNVEAFPVVADFLAGTRWPGTVVMGGSARARVAGVRLVADDLDWAHGRGPVVHARGETLLRLLAGRPVGQDELTGPGVPTLAERL